jgi:hypothetical protein
MKTRNHFLTLVMGSALVFFTGCENNDPALEKPKPDGEALMEEFGTNLNEAKQEFTVNAATGGSITGKEGTVVQFFSNGFKKPNGETVTGDVKVELIELFSKADMLLKDMPTLGRKDGKIATLISGGEFYVNATQDGTQLVSAGYSLAVPTAKTGGPDTEMHLFNGKEECTNTDCDVIWEENDKGAIQIGERGGATGGGQGIQSVYYAFQSQFGWTNIDKWYSDPRPKTTIFVDVPEGYDKTNCEVYLSYDGEPTALARFDTYNDDTDLFSEHYGLIPIGLQVHFVMVSIVDGQYNYAVQAATITNNHVQVISALTPTTEEDLIDIINDLP